MPYLWRPRRLHLALVQFSSCVQRPAALRLHHALWEARTTQCKAQTGVADHACWPGHPRSAQKRLLPVSQYVNLWPGDDTEPAYSPATCFALY